MSLLRKLFNLGGHSLAKQAEQSLIEHFSAYWEQHPSTDEQRQEVVDLIRERVSTTTPDVLREILDVRAPLKAAGILDKMVDRVYGGNSDFFFKRLSQEWAVRFGARKDG